MAETAKIAKIAEIISQEIFSVFGWKQRPHRDQNWACVVKAHKKATHPSDVVFSYDSPLEAGRVYLTVDLKSYAKDTINKDKIEAALLSLSLSTHCANQSEEFQELYLNEETNPRVHGMLFVFNHDGAYDKDFIKLLSSIKQSSLRIKAGYRLFVFGPKEIHYLQAVANDIVKKRGRKEIPDGEACKFYHPDLVRARVTSNTLEAATAEMLLSPWLVMKYDSRVVGGKHGYLVYYRGEASSSDELKFLIDYLFRFQLVADMAEIEIRAPFADARSTAYFETAKEQYAKEYFEFEEFQTRLAQIKFSSIQTVENNFSTIELGMD